MGYALLWLELLATAGLVGGAILATFPAGRRRFVGFGLFALNWLVFFLLAVGLVVLDQVFRGSLGLTGPMIGFAAGLTLVLAWVARRGLRRGEDQQPGAARWPRGKLVVAAFVASALVVSNFWSLDLQVREQLAALQSEAESLALSATPARVRDQDNAAIYYQGAFEVLQGQAQWPKIWQEALEADNPKRETPFDFASSELSAFLATKKPFHERILLAAGKPACYFERDYGRPSLDMLFPELNHMRELGAFLEIDARSKAALGQIRPALENVRALRGMADQLLADSFFVSLLTSILLDETANETIERVLSAGVATEEDLAYLAAGIQSSWESYRGARHRSLRMEEATGLSFLGRIALRGDVWNGSEGALTVPPLRVLYHVLIVPIEIRGLRQGFEEVASYAPDLPWNAPAPEMANSKPPLPGMFANMGTCALDNASQAVVGAEAKRRVTEVGVAMYRYQLRQGKFPQQLADLERELDLLVPLDPFDGNPLRLGANEKGPIVYSIGPDKKDDRGEPVDEDVNRDVTFQCFLPKK